MAAPDEQDVFKDVKVLTVSEVGVLFERNLEMWQRRDPDYQPSAMLAKAAEYAQRFATNKNKDTVQKIRELLASRQLTELELGLVANLSIETADEAKKLVPTLDRYSDEDLDSMLKELATYREFE
ncbi:DNA-directed RNA polymerase II subunit 4 [Micractinium conductrix]|uniref:DNA-directed RNA polymerase II subunit 4 n=1 Tax=Micractinium conductrix TaxID=554055 RepID=A0A2P6V1S9_9CHLO|nr:DNA-directed RNA polymerase II subunit 4 [Micractinium conductrix]|eukprot:PSC68049.1 DNA-directed RNA polymerase II subunit 4 [Micractinium conductrix]